jgi:hypothetical protein
MPSWMYQYPKPPYASEQPFWLNFYVAKYSLKNNERTRPGIQSNAFGHLMLPLPRDVGYTMNHEFGEAGRTPIAASIVVDSSVANNGGMENRQQIKDRENLASAAFFEEYRTATSTFRRFANITELTMVSEARKKYAFEYIFVPKNQNESQEVEEIVGSFRKCSYPSVASGLPERTYPQNLWTLVVTKNSNFTSTSNNLTSDWLGDPLPCVLRSVTVKKNDKADPVVRLLPNGYSNITLLGLVFEEFETGSFDGTRILSKSEVSVNSFGNTPAI